MHGRRQPLSHAAQRREYAQLAVKQWLQGVVNEVAVPWEPGEGGSLGESLADGLHGGGCGDPHVFILRTTAADEGQKENAMRH